MSLHSILPRRQRNTKRNFHSEQNALNCHTITTWSCEFSEWWARSVYISHITRNMIMWPPLSSLHPALYTISVNIRRFARRVHWLYHAASYALEQERALLPFRVKRHQSVLIRRLGESDIRLQKNKICNLQKVIPLLDGILIRPGETFSFWKLVGRPTRERWFLEGMELSMGKVRSWVWGWLCQMSNLLFWLVLHSPMNILERHHHSFDPFPDEGRVLPFGSGATLFYNYIDLQFRNTTSRTFQLHVWLTDTHLCGEIRSDIPCEYRYHVFEKNHAFLG